MAHTIKLSDKYLAIIIDLLNIASDGWYSDEVYNAKYFKNDKQQEAHVIKLIKKLDINP